MGEANFALAKQPVQNLRYDHIRLGVALARLLDFVCHRRNQVSQCHSDPLIFIHDRSSSTFIGAVKFTFRVPFVINADSNAHATVLEITDCPLIRETDEAERRSSDRVRAEDFIQTARVCLFC